MPLLDHQAVRFNSSPPTLSASHASSGTHEAVSRGKVLLVDDDPMVLRGASRVLRGRGYEVTTCDNGEGAIKHLATHGVDVIVSDISMPEMDGIQLLRKARDFDLHVPVILITGEPAVSTAVQALEYGAFHYLTKPTNADDLDRVVERAVQLHRMARFKEQAAELLGSNDGRAADRAGLEASFQRALDTLWVAYQPIVSASTHDIFGHEALLRSDEPSLPHPGAVLDAATRLDSLNVLGRAVRDLAAAPAIAVPRQTGILFVNLHVTDLLDPELMNPTSALASIAKRVVLEITERSSLDEVRDVKARIASLREMGFRIAVDDLGAGYAGLTSFAQLEPEVVKLDMSLVRDVHESKTKQKVIRSMTALCKDMGMLVVAEGVENPEERDALVHLGCDLLQGFWFARPGKPFPEVRW